jgi:3-oxoacyl-[acyl-carrier protein] reductase
MLDLAIITGAGSGIGKAIALKLGSEGIPLLLIGRKPSCSITQSIIISNGGSAEIMECDLSDYIKIKDKLPKIIEKKQAKKIGILLAAAVLDNPKNNDISSELEIVFKINVIGNLAVLESCLPQLIKNKSGRVIFFAGGGAAYANPEFPAYSLSKVSTVRLVENLAATYPPSTGCSFICLAPGAVDTPMLSQVIAKGSVVKTKTGIEEPVGFASYYFNSDSTLLSGRYIHVRDEWKAYLDGIKPLIKDQFYLRRNQ